LKKLLLKSLRLRQVFQPVELSKQLVVWHLVVFKMIWKSLALFLLCCQTKTIGFFEKQLVVFMKSLIEKLFQSILLENNLLFL